MYKLSSNCAAALPKTLILLAKICEEILRRLPRDSRREASYNLCRSKGTSKDSLLKNPIWAENHNALNTARLTAAWHA